VGRGRLPRITSPAKAARRSRFEPSPVGDPVDAADAVIQRLDAARASAAGRRNRLPFDPRARVIWPLSPTITLKPVPSADRDLVVAAATDDQVVPSADPDHVVAGLRSSRPPR